MKAQVFNWLTPLSVELQVEHLQVVNTVDLHLLLLNQICVYFSVLYSFA